MRLHGRIATLLVAGAALAACSGGSGGSGGYDGSGGGGHADAGTPRTPSTTSAGLRWSPPRQGPERPAAGTATVSRERHGRDLNGDGYDDLAAYDKDRINIVYGSPHGLDPRTRTTVRACLLKPPVPAAEDVRLVRADLDGDGHTDLIADFSGRRALVLWSGPRGITEVSDLPDQGAVETGDFDGDGHADLFRLGTTETSSGTVAYGPLRRDGAPARRQDLKDPPPGKDSVPYEATAADIDGDGRTDLAVRMRWTDPESEGDGDITDTGLWVHRGGSGGLRYDAGRSGPHVLGRVGVPADVDGNGTEDVTEVTFLAFRKELHITTQRGEDREGHTTVLHRIPGVGVRAPDFGGTKGLAIGDVTGDGRADLVVGADQANNNQGLVLLLRDAAHPAEGHLQAVDLESPGVPGEDGRYRRTRLAPVAPLLDVDGDGHLDVVATARWGGYWTLPGADTGLDTSRTRRVTRGQLD
ncbi:FG-GAP-like repeat-containing protein [Streptomyces antimycoticus]|uniref:FG-GAP and VCBS repeat-containing protein n=1 Tax=Streptomyces antimycoticus TaxID=68175 RepID=UPI0031E6E049